VTGGLEFEPLAKIVERLRAVVGGGQDALAGVEETVVDMMPDEND
jgi:hypothetical protein